MSGLAERSTVNLDLFGLFKVMVSFKVENI